MCEASVIIVNWNGRQYLQSCLDAVMSQSFVDFEVILVDNGSTDDSVQFVRAHYGEVRIVQLAENLGFTGGNHAGLDVASGQFIALLNNDTRVEPGWLGSLINGMKSHADVGICASRIIIDGTDRIDSIGDRFTTAFTGTKIGHQKSAHIFDTAQPVQGGCAAAILYRRSMLNQIGFFDDEFFFNHEDTDLNLRAWLSGWKCIYVPDAVVHHKVSASVGELSATTVYYFSRNNEWVWIKNVPLGLMIRYFPQRVLYELASLFFYGFRSQMLRPFLKGKIDALWKIPAMLAKRRAIQRSKIITSQEISNNLMPLTDYLYERLTPHN
jgi:GT2 family glycosyltransferase